MRLSISRIKLFKACRRAYYLRYIEGLVPVRKPEALETGSNYHARLEAMYNGDESEIAQDFSKEQAMAEAYRKYIFPRFHVKHAEKWMERPIKNGDLFCGIADGIADGGYLVEHKTAAGPTNLDEYEYDLQWDEQILAYMSLSGLRKVWYTVIKKPTIRQRKDESDEEFYNRMLAWYDEDTDSKIRLMEITRTDDEVAEWNAQLNVIHEEISRAERICRELHNAPRIMYRNQGWCSRWGRRCEYASVCLDYNPDEEHVEFFKEERVD